MNHKSAADNIRRVATKYFGGVSDQDLPTNASDDFCYFIQSLTGAYFCLGTKRKENENLHTSAYDFNDDQLATGAHFWVRLVEDRLNIRLLD